MSKTKETKKQTTNGSGKSVETKSQEFDFGDSKIAKSLEKAITLTRQRLYPERYDGKGRLKKEWTK